MDELRLVPEAEGGPSVLGVEAAVGAAVILEAGDHRLQENCERSSRLESCRLVGNPNLERAEARMRTHVPLPSLSIVSSPPSISARSRMLARPM